MYLYVNGKKQKFTPPQPSPLAQSPESQPTDVDDKHTQYFNGNGSSSLFIIISLIALGIVTCYLISCILKSKKHQA